MSYNVTFDVCRFNKAFRKYWYILPICALIGVAVIVLNITKPNIIKNASEIYKTSDNVYFQKVAYVKIDWGNEGLEELDTNAERPLVLQEYEKRMEEHREILENCRHLFSYIDIRKEIDDLLKNNGYEEIGNTDHISYSYSDTMFFITINSQCSTDRIKFLLEKITSVIIREGQARFKLGNCFVDSYSDIYISQKTNNTYYRINKTADVWLEEANRNRIIEIKTLKFNLIEGTAIIIMSLFIGILILSVIAFNDKTIVSSQELSAFKDIPFLGSMSRNSCDGLDYILKVKLNNCKNITIIIASEYDSDIASIDILKETLMKSGIDAKVIINRRDIELYLSDISKSDGVIIMALKDKTLVNDIFYIENILRVVEISVTGSAFIVL